VQLHIARLCLDCDEVYDQQTCPDLQLGIIRLHQPLDSAPERRARPRPAATESRETLDTIGSYSTPTTRNPAPAAG
jgi:hypothetical protein